MTEPMPYNIINIYRWSKRGNSGSAFRECHASRQMKFQWSVI
jgi:hypothetical protein